MYMHPLFEINYKDMFAIQCAVVLQLQIKYFAGSTTDLSFYKTRAYFGV